MKKASTLLTVSIAAVLGLGNGLAQTGEDQRNFEFKQCDEHVLGLLLDAEPVQEYLGPEFPLVVENGKVRVGIIIQDCSQYWIDGKNLGLNKHAHVLVEMEGPRDVRPVVGAEVTLPTMTWFSISAASTNPKDYEAREKSGTSPTLIEAIELKVLEPNRGGKVIFSDGLTYSWQVSSERFEGGLAQMLGTAQLVGVNHVVYTKAPSGKVVIKRIQVLVNATVAPNKGMLHVVGGTDPSRLIGSGTYPISVYTFLPVWVQATLGEQPPEMGSTNQ